MLLKLAALAALAFATPAQAEWLKASTRHFVIYSDTRPEEIARLATRLEQVDGALRLISGIEDTAEAAANPVTVYVLDDVAAIRRLIGQANVGGFYIPRADGAVAFAPRTVGDASGASGQLVLFHEYAHHFLLGASGSAYPAWLAEGYAEFVSTAIFDKKGVTIGGAAQHRAYGLTAVRSLPIETLLAPPPNMTPQQTDQLYGRGWLLTHYLLLGGRPREQLVRYVNALNTGAPALKAAADAFGDLRALDRELDRYLRGRLMGYVLSPDRLPTPAVEVRPLTPGERALIASRIQSTRGVNAKTAGPLYARAAQAAAAHPNDPVAQGWLAEMAYDAGQDAAAEAAADRALAADPKSVQALLYKARVRLRRAATTKSTDPAVWREARSWIVKANRVNTNGAAALLLFYDSFAMEGAKPSASAVAGLHRAVELVPQDKGLRFRSVAQHLRDGQIADAKLTLRPLAFDPHAGPDNPAAKLMALLDRGEAGPAALAAATAADATEDAPSPAPAR